MRTEVITCESPPMSDVETLSGEIQLSDAHYHGYYKLISLVFYSLQGRSVLRIRLQLSRSEFSPHDNVGLLRT